MMHQKEIFLPYKIIEEPGEGEYEEKKSRFIAKIVPAASERSEEHTSELQSQR